MYLHNGMDDRVDRGRGIRRLTLSPALRYPSATSEVCSPALNKDSACERSSPPKDKTCDDQHVKSFSSTNMISHVEQVI